MDKIFLNVRLHDDEKHRVSAQHVLADIFTG